MNTRQILAIVIAVIGVAVSGSYFYSHLRLKPGRDCFNHFVELEKTKDLRLVNMFDAQSKVTIKSVYPDKTVTIKRMEGDRFRQAYHDYLTSEEAQSDVDEYWDIKVEKVDGNFVVNTVNYRVNENTQGPFRIVFDGTRTDNCMVLESSVVFYTNKSNPFNKPEESPEPPTPLELPLPTAQ